MRPIDITTLESVRTAADEFTARFADCIKTRPSRGHFRTYLDGQLSGLPHKSIEAIAQRAEVEPRTLQEFLATNRWDHERLLDRLQQFVATEHAEPDGHAALVIDETGNSKRGDKTPGVQRQYNGQLGKIDNCVVTVGLGYATKDFHALLDSELFLPESWSNDRERCREARIPDDIVHRPKWQIGLELLDRAVGNGVTFRHVIADEAYGAVPGFRDGIADRGFNYIVEVPGTMRGWIGSRPQTEVPERRSLRGRAPQKPALVAGAPKAIEVRGLATDDDAARRADPTTWMQWDVKDTQRGPQVWDVRVERFWPSRDRLPEAEPQWLIVAVHGLNEMRKYFLSNAPADADVSQLIEAAFGRWHIERCFRDAKQQVGINDYELRTWIGLRRHLVLSIASLLFLATQTRRLRSEKGALHTGASSR
ncbi:MAG: IS701 family transposase [Planctomycetota bacterium]